jgi:hypothetical protein
MGAAAVLDTAADTPPIRKSTRNPCTPFSFGAAGTKTEEEEEEEEDLAAVAQLEVAGSMLCPPVKSMGQRAFKPLQAALGTDPASLDVVKKGDPLTISAF